MGMTGTPTQATRLKTTPAAKAQTPSQPPPTPSTPPSSSEIAEATKSTVRQVLSTSPRRSTWLLRVQGLASVLFRLAAFVFLRIIPGWFGFYAIHLYAIYFLAWLLYDVRARRRPSSEAFSLRSVVLGTSTKSRSLNLVHLAINTIVLLWVLDLYYAPHMFPSHRESSLRFARMGHISPTSATVHVRYPTPLPPLTGLWDTGLDDVGELTDASTINEAPLRVIWRRVADQDDNAPALNTVRDPRRWERGPLLTLTNATDWTAVAELPDLWPATKYEWRLAFVHNNTFTPMPDRPIPFMTWPDPRLSAYRKTKFAENEAPVSDAIPLDDPNHFKFAAFSCVKPDFPYHPAQFWGWNWLLRWLGLGTEQGGITSRNRIPGFDLMANHLASSSHRLSGLRFLLELGDLIYADVPRYGGPSVESYRQLYRNLFASSSFQRIYRSIPILGMYDDHEIVNNWSGGGYNEDNFLHSESAHDNEAERVDAPIGLGAGLQAWSEYVGRANPPSEAESEHYYSFQYGDSAFFVLDTRKHRTHLDTDEEERTMLGQQQRDALLDWLHKVNQTATFKFIASSVPFTSLWGGPLDLDGRTDGWSYFPHERRMLLDVLQYVPNVIILSGDRHEFASVSFRDSVLEFSTSPLSMFYIPIRTLSQEHSIDPPGEEVLLKYLPDGNYKWTELEVDTRDPQRPLVKVSVQVDGQPAWNVQIEGKPVHQPLSALGALAKSLLELLGFRNLDWF